MYVNLSGVVIGKELALKMRAMNMTVMVMKDGCIITSLFSVRSSLPCYRKNENLMLPLLQGATPSTVLLGIYLTPGLN